ncbi:hypothetical protein OMCYN_01726 [cyanobiont of Ornithocercus magnificus]|nr:hypothetical protein OMCYN_01726 [cyanobiont of Ornithocercus magnificus]
MGPTEKWAWREHHCHALGDEIQRVPSPASPNRLPHRLPSLNRVVTQHPPPSHRLRRAWRNVAVGPDGYPLRMHGRRVGLEVTELLLLLGVQPPLTTSLFWRLVKAAILVGHTRSTSQTGWHTESFDVRPLLLLSALLLTAQPALAESDIERIKKCAQQVRLERARWYFNETGQTTSPSSSTAQDYANYMESMGLKTKTPIPFRLCM